MRVQKRTIQKWCDALRSGEYEQDEGAMQTENGFCCLGVACKVFIPENKLKKREGSLYGEFPMNQPSTPLWLRDMNEDFEYLTGKALSDLNDSGKYNFNEIADLIEAVYIHEVLA